MQQIIKLVKMRGKVPDSELLDLIEQESERWLTYDQLRDRLRHLHGNPDPTQTIRTRLTKTEIIQRLRMGGLKKAEYSKLRTRDEFRAFLIGKVNYLRLNPGGLFPWTTKSGAAIKGNRKPSPAKLADIAGSIGMTMEVTTMFRNSKHLSVGDKVQVYSDGVWLAGEVVFCVNYYQFTVKYEVGGMSVSRIFNLNQIKWKN